MSEKTATTARPAMPAGPATERQRRFLRRLIERAERLTLLINQAKAYADKEIASLQTGSITMIGALGAGLAHSGADVMAARAQIATMVESLGAYGLTAEQATYAIYLGATETTFHDNGADAWLYRPSVSEG